MRILLMALLASISLTATANDDCGSPYVIDENKADMGPRHHPIGRPLPATGAFHQPTGCLEGLWFYDRNGNGSPDAAEPRLFGAQRVVDCGSCHGESPATRSAASASVFLRLDAATLCTVCHNL
ncbi:hypothetical protein [Denitratisoma oestradiolicum]|uniref:Doubled CXXCH motif domain-containing protein n=1 Tax=Denitratisoma oestradiolicum TaxID=311182 RepID=A0A6S6YNA9_9PROT|nr:hypothetical protein [Denitratisoma oestradiolicum]CAB1369248.1 conserved exported protein of unknown function [Denitratisoma oestradiolicum]